jgi:hypothetical protein
MPARRFTPPWSNRGIRRRLLLFLFGGGYSNQTFEGVGVSMTRLFLVSAMLVGAAAGSLSTAFAQSYSQYDSQYYGDTIHGSNGSRGNWVYQPGESWSPTVLGSDGSTYIRFGNTIYGSDGSSYTRSGNNVYGSDGRHCSIFGNTAYCD